MKLTVQKNREAIRRYGHIKPASRLAASRCSAHCPGTKRTCTLERGHRGPHVSHGLFRKVVAVWDAGTRTHEPEQKVKRAVTSVSRDASWDQGPVASLATFVRRIVRRAPPMEETLFIVFFVAMVGFFIDWALRIIAGG
jgi:hypothetical protein